MASVTLRAKEINKKGFSLFLDIYNEGRRHKEYLKLYVSKDYTRPENKNVLRKDKESWDLASAIQAKRLLQMKETLAGFIPKANKQDFLQYYRDQAEKKNHGSYSDALKYLLEFNSLDKLSFKTLDENYLKDFIAFLKEQPLSHSTMRMYLSRISIILNLAVKDKIIHANPFDYLKRGRDGDIPSARPQKITYLTIEELRKLNEIAYREDVKQFFFFSCFSGLRVSDLLKMKWSDIDKKILTYSQKKQRNSITHYLPLSAQALRILDDIKVFQTAKLGEMNEFVFARHLKKWEAEAKLNKRLHIHVGRHTYATLALSNNVSLYTVSKMLGHSNISVTQVYAEVIDKVKQEAAEMLPSL
jgi:integrase